MAPFESTDHGFINSSDDIEEGTTNQFFTQARAHASFSVSNRPTNILGDQVFDGQTFTNGGLHFASGTITYIPPNLINLAAYATLANPAFTGTPTVGGTAIKVNVGDGALTEKNFTSALNTKLGGIAENADVTPSLAAYATLASPAFTGAPTINGAAFMAPSKFAYYLAPGTQSLTAGQDNLVSFSIQDENTMSSDLVATSSTTFKVNTPGAYRIDTQVWVIHTPQELIGCYLYIYQNSTIIAQGRHYSGQIYPGGDYADLEYFTLNTFRIKTFSQNDLITVYVRPHITSGGNPTVAGGASGTNGNSSMISFQKL